MQEIERLLARLWKKYQRGRGGIKPAVQSIGDCLGWPITNVSK